MPMTLSVFIFSLKNYDHQEALQFRLRQASRSIKRILTPRRGSGDQGDSDNHRHRHVVHHDSEVQQNQGAGAGLIESAQHESAQMESDSVAHDQQCSSESRISRIDEPVEVMHQVMLQCVSVTELSFMEKKARSRKDSGRDQSTTITSLSSGIMSHVIWLVLFIRFVIFLFNSLHASDQSSAQKSSAQPFVTDAVFDSNSEQSYQPH